jgi:hypothetical protein
MFLFRSRCDYSATENQHVGGNPRTAVAERIGAALSSAATGVLVLKKHRIANTAAIEALAVPMLRVCPKTSVRITKFSEHEPD